MIWAKPWTMSGIDTCTAMKMVTLVQVEVCNGFFTFQSGQIFSYLKKDNHSVTLKVKTEFVKLLS